LRQTPISRSYFYISFRFPSKGAQPLGPASRIPTGRSDPFPEHQCGRLPKSPVKEPTTVCNEAPAERDAGFMGFPLYYIHDLPLNPYERDAPFPEAFFVCLSVSRVNGPPSRFPNAVLLTGMYVF
jgi:hypothetical protein